MKPCRSWQRKRFVFSDDVPVATSSLVQLLHEKALVPGLGHPAASQQLQDLSCAEQQRHRCCQEQIRSHSADLQVHVATPVPWSMYTCYRCV